MPFDSNHYDLGTLQAPRSGPPRLGWPWRATGSWLAACQLLLPGCQPASTDERAKEDTGREARILLQAAPLVEFPDSQVAVRVLPADGRNDSLVVANVFGDSLQFARITFILAIGDGLLLVGDRRTSPHLVVLDVKTREVVASLGRHGEGPGEFLDPTYAQLARSNTGESVAWIYDFNLRRASQLNVSDPRDPRLVGTRLLNVGVSLLGAAIVDSHVIANGLFGNFVAAYFDTSGVPTRRVAVPLPFPEEKTGSPTATRLLNRTHMAVSPDGQVFALAYQSSPRIDFFQASNGQWLRSSEGPGQAKAAYRVSPDNGRFFWLDDNEDAYWGVVGSSSRVFALFRGTSDRDGLLASTVHVFDWDGQYIGRLALDRGIMALGLDESGTVLYGGSEEPYPQVSMWQLPSWAVGS